MSRRPPEHVPLARLFASAFRMLVDDLHAGLRRRGWSDVRPAFGFVLLALRDAPRTANELAAHLGTSKQASSKLLASLVAAGYVRRSPRVPDGRQRPLELTARGRKLLGTVEDLYAELEAGWATVIGDRAVERLRTDVARVLRARHAGALPPVRPLVAETD